MNGAIAKADVVVVGCGVVGMAAAERLVAAGRSVVLIDERGVAGGATAASGGLVRALDLVADASAWATEGLGVYLRRGWRGTWPAVREHGSLVLCGPEDAERAVAAAGLVRAAGQPVDIFTAAEIRARFPGLTPREDAFGVYEYRAGWLPAREVVESMLRDAAHGLTVLGSIQALGLLTEGSRVSGVRTSAGPVSAPAVLLAAGSGSTRLARSAGVDLPLCNRSVSYCVFTPRVVDRGDIPAVVDTTTGAWMRRWGARNAVLGGVVSSDSGVAPVATVGVSATEQQRVRTVLKSCYPRLADAALTGGVTAYDAMSPDQRGAVTAWPQAPGLVTATGWNGGGFKIAPVIGRQVAACVEEVFA